MPLVGIGELKMESAEQQMVDGVEQSCVPQHRCATAANENLIFTLPKEVSLFAEGDPDEAKAAMYAAAQKSLEALYGDTHYTAGAAVYRRNENGEIHYQARILVVKFAEDWATAKPSTAAVATRDIGSSPS